jgi:hypothetical protein
VNVEDLLTTALVRQANLDVHLEAPRTQNGGID